jgi:hypothetical protein
MKKTLFKIAVITFGIVISMSSCKKKTDDPTPIVIIEQKQDTTKNNSGIKSPYYVFDNDTSKRFIDKYNGKTLRFVKNGDSDTLTISISVKISSSGSWSYIEKKTKYFDCINFNIKSLKYKKEENREFLFFNKNKFVKDMFYNINIDTTPWGKVENNLGNDEYYNIKIINDNNSFITLYIGWDGNTQTNYKSIL